MNERAAPPSPEKPEAPKKPAVRRADLCRSEGGTASSCRPRWRSWKRRPRRIPVALMLTICAFFAAALAWSFVGRLDVHAVAPGKIETVSRAKVIQPFDNGKIAAIHVANGQHVKAGDLLLEIDPAEAAADAEDARDERFESLAEIARRRYAVASPRSLGAARARRRERGLRARRDRRADRRRPRRRSASTPKAARTSGCASAACSPPTSTSSPTRSPRSTSRSRRKRRRASAST